MKKFVMTAVVALAALGTVNAADAFVYQGGLIKVGSTGAQVYALQTCLAEKGINSYSNIDGEFGSRTKAAVMAFQVSKGLDQIDGIIGKVTGPLYTASCADEVKEEEKDEVKESELNGEEADVTIEDIDDVDDLTNNKKEQKAFTFEIEADEKGGDAAITRADLTFEITPNAANSSAEADVYDIIEKVTIEVDGKEIASVSSDDDDDWRNLSSSDKVGTIRLSGFESIVKSDEKVEFTVLLDIADLDNETNSAQSDLDLDIELSEVEVRYIDGASITDEVSKTSTKKVTVEGTEGIEFDFDKDNDQESTLVISLSDEDKSDVTLALYEFEVDEEDGTLDKVEVEITVTKETGNFATTSKISDLLKEVELFIDGESIDDDSSSVAATATNSFVVTYTFDVDSEDEDVKDGKTYEFEVKGDFRELDSGSEFVNSKVQVTKAILKGEADNDDDFNVEENLSGTRVTAAAGALILDSVDVKGFDKEGDSAAEAIFTVKLENDATTGLDLVNFVFDINGEDVIVTKSGTVTLPSGLMTKLDLVATVKEDDKDGDSLDLGADDATDTIDEDDKESYYVKLFISAKDDQSATQIDAELKSVTYDTDKVLLIEKEADEVTIDA